MTWTLVYKRLKIGPAFSPAVCKLCVFLSLPGFADGDKQTELNQTLPNGGQQIALRICRKTVGVVVPEKVGHQKHLHLFVFRRLRDLMANIFWTKRDIDNRIRAVKGTNGFLHCQKFHELWSINPPSLFCSVSGHHIPSKRHYMRL